MTSLNSTIAILKQPAGKIFGQEPPAPVDLRTDPLLMRDYTPALLGLEPHGLFVRLMMTMPSEAATQPQLV